MPRRFPAKLLRRMVAAGLWLCLGLPSTASAADALDKAAGASLSDSAAEAESQDRIDRLDEAARKALQEYRRLSRKVEALEGYNDQLQRMIASQEEEKASLHRQIAGIEDTQREIYPLMQRMVAALDDFVAADRPFLPEERHRRLGQLHELMDRADVGVAEKYRRVLEAYQIESDYGRKIEAYRGRLDGADGGRTVDFLRLGRLGLYYQTLDGGETGYWDAAAGDWQRLPETYALPVREGLRMAREQVAPDLLRLPVPAPTEFDPQGFKLPENGPGGRP